MREQLRGGRLLDDLPRIHDGDVVSVATDQTEIVRNQQHGELLLTLKLPTLLLPL